MKKKSAVEKLKFKYLRVTMPDGSRWDVPTRLIAEHRAEYYRDEYDNDTEKSLAQDTVPLFNSDDYEIKDWAANNMNWEDVESGAVRVSDDPPEVDFQEGWTNGEKELI